MRLSEALVLAPTLRWTRSFNERIDSLRYELMERLALISPRLGIAPFDSCALFIEIEQPSDVEKIAHCIDERDVGVAAVAIAHHAFAAYCATRMLLHNQALPKTRVQERTVRRTSVLHESDAHVLSYAPVEWLPISLSMKRALAALGIVHMGQLAALPVEGVHARFGEEGRAMWRLSKGEPLAVLSTFVARDEPNVTVDFSQLGNASSDRKAGAYSLDALLFGLRTACVRLIPRLRFLGHGIVHARVLLYREQGVLSVDVRPARADIDHESLFTLARSLIELALNTPSALGDDSTNCVQQLAIHVVQSSPISVHSESLIFDKKSVQRLPLDVALARLRARFGAEHVNLTQKQEDPRPEHRGRFVPASMQHLQQARLQIPQWPPRLRERLRVPAPALGAVLLSRLPTLGEPWPVRTIGMRTKAQEQRTVAAISPLEHLTGLWWQEPYELYYRWLEASDGTRALFTRASTHGGWRLVGSAD